MTASQPSPARQFMRSSGKMALLYAGSTVIMFLVGVLLAGLLGAAGYGTYALALTIATLAGLAAEFGLPVLAMRETGKARSDGNWAALRGLIFWSDRVIFCLSLMLIAATFAVFFLLAPNRSSAFWPTILWAVALLPFVGIGKLRSFVLLALDQIFSSQFPILIVRPLFFSAGCLALYMFHGVLTPQSAMGAQVMGAVMAMLVLMMLYHRHRPSELAVARPAFDVRNWLHAGLPMGLTEGLRLLQGQLGLLLVGLLASAAQAGVYRVADAVAQLTALSASIVGTAATPMFARLWKAEDREGIELVSVQAAWAMVLGAMALGLPLALTGQWLFPMIFGAEFTESASVFWILWGGTVLASCGGLSLTLANMTGHHALSTQSFLIIAAVNIGVGGSLSSAYGATGAAIGSAIGLISGTIWCSWQLYRRTGLNCTLSNRAAPAILGRAYRAGRLAMRSAKTGI